jgi:hypothetical protein
VIHITDCKRWEIRPGTDSVRRNPFNNYCNLMRSSLSATSKTSDYLDIQSSKRSSTLLESAYEDTANRFGSMLEKRKNIADATNPHSLPIPSFSHHDLNLEDHSTSAEERRSLAEGLPLEIRLPFLV